LGKKQRPVEKTNGGEGETNLGERLPGGKKNLKITPAQNDENRFGGEFKQK